MFSPTHKHAGRWTSKNSDVLNRVLTNLQQLGKIDVVSPSQPVPPETLFDIRRTCHMSIDEISTGGFHMVSLEGMCAGNIVINRADFFGKATFASFCEGNMPPFVYTNESEVADTLMQFASDAELTRLKQSEAYAYFQEFCTPIKLVAKINELY